MAINLFGNGTGATLQQMADNIASMADDLDAIRSQQDVQIPAPPESYAVTVPIAPTTWQTSEQIVITGLLITSDTADFYSLRIGNDSSFKFGLTPMVPQFFIFTGANRLPVPAGMTLSIVQQTVPGTAIVNANIWYLSPPWFGRTV